MTSDYVLGDEALDTLEAILNYVSTDPDGAAAAQEAWETAGGIVLEHRRRRSGATLWVDNGRGRRLLGRRFEPDAAADMCAWAPAEMVNAARIRALPAASSHDWFAQVGDWLIAPDWRSAATPIRASDFDATWSVEGSATVDPIDRRVLRLLRRLRADRPSVHTDDLWAELNDLIDLLDRTQR